MERFRKFTWPQGVEESVLRQKKVTCKIPVQTEYRRITYRREGDTLINSIYKETGCIVVAHWEQQFIKSFDIFAGPGSTNAIVAVNKWIAQCNEKSNASSAWAKTPAFSHEDWHQEQLQRMEEEQNEYFLGPVPDPQEDEPVRHKIVVKWPEDLLNHELIPRTVFGNELQGLNDIRKQDKVFIVSLPDHAVEVMGFDALNVESAEGHYRTLLDKVKAEKCSFNQALNMILDEREGIDVLLLEAESWWPNLTDMVVPRLLPSAMMDQPGRFCDDGLFDQQLLKIQSAIKQSLEAVSYRKGFYDFVVRLGCVALDSKKLGKDHIGKKHGKEKFTKSINGKVDLKPKKWLLDDIRGKQLFDRLTAADSILEPTMSAGCWGSMPSKLEETRPTLRGTWIFRDPNDIQKEPPPARNVGRSTPLQQMPPDAESNTPSNLIVVQADWTDDDEGPYEKTATRYYRLEAGKSGPRMNMDINLLELGESRAWSFTLESRTPISPATVPPVLTGFAQRVVIKKGYDVNSSQSFAEWERTPSVRRLLLHGRLDKIYSFGVQKTCYKVELTAMSYLGHSSLCWGLAVRHIEWATHLAELERLQTGHQASWGNILETFLPKNGGSSAQPAGEDDLDVGSLTIDKDRPKVSRVLSHGGLSTLTDIMLQLSKIVSSVTIGEDVPV